MATLMSSWGGNAVQTTTAKLSRLKAQRLIYSVRTLGIKITRAVTTGQESRGFHTGFSEGEGGGGG